MSENSPPEPGNTTINLEQLQSLINAQAQLLPHKTINIEQLQFTLMLNFM